MVFLDTVFKKWREESYDAYCTALNLSACHLSQQEIGLSMQGQQVSSIALKAVFLAHKLELCCSQLSEIPFKKQDISNFLVGGQNFKLLFKKMHIFFSLLLPGIPAAGIQQRVQ